MSSSSLTPAVCRPRPLSIEAFAALTTASVIGAAWWMGSMGAGRHELPTGCAPKDQVTSAQVEAAVARVREADRRARYTAIGGSGYVAAKVGMAKGSPERRLAQTAAQDLAFARRELAQLCEAALADRGTAPVG